MSLYKRCEHKGKLRDSCEHGWWSVLKVNGVRTRESLETYFTTECRGKGSKFPAHALEEKLRAAIKAGTYVSTAARVPTSGAALTVRDFFAVYKTGYVDLKGLRSWDGDRVFKVRRINQYKTGGIGPEWGDRLLSSIAITDIEAFLAGLKRNGNGPASIKRWYALFHQALGWAETRGFIDRSPIYRKNAIELEAESGERTRRPSVAELEAILEHADPLMRDLIEVVLDLGLRQGSLRLLTGADVVFTAGVKTRFGLLRVPARANKNKKMLTLPMSARVHAILLARFTALDENRAGFLFGNEIGEVFASKTIWSLWDTTLRRAGLKTDDVDPDLHFHDLRGEAASQLHERGVPIGTIQKFLGHSTLAMTQKYLRARVGELEELVGAFENISFVERKRTTERTTAAKVLEMAEGRKARKG